MSEYLLWTALFVMLGLLVTAAALFTSSLYSFIRKDLDHMAYVVVRWNRAVPHIFTNSHLKLRSEAMEYANEPSLEEGADVFIALITALTQQGWSPTDLRVAVQKKMKVNQQREWKASADGTYQHVERQAP